MTKEHRKKEREENLFKSFKELHTGFPTGSYECGESPDFLFTTSDQKTIGIELADVLTSQKFQEHLSLQKKLADKVVVRLDRLLQFTFALTLKINEKTVNSKEIIKLSEAIAESCYSEFIDLQDNKSRRLRNFGPNIIGYPEDVKIRMIEQGYRELPPQLKYIEIRRASKIGYSFNTQATGLSMPDFEIEHIADVLEDKNEKLKRYKKADEQWLVLCIGHGPSTYFSNINIEIPIVSDFGKVYLLRVDNRDVIELK